MLAANNCALHSELFGLVKFPSQKYVCCSDVEPHRLQASLAKVTVGYVGTFWKVLEEIPTNQYQRNWTQTASMSEPIVVQETAFIPGVRVSSKNERFGPTECDRQWAYSISFTSPLGALPMVSLQDITIFADLFSAISKLCCSVSLGFHSQKRHYVSVWFPGRARWMCEMVSELSLQASQVR